MEGTVYEMGDYHSWRTWKQGRASDITRGEKPYTLPWFIVPYHPRCFPSPPHTPHPSLAH